MRCRGKVKLKRPQPRQENPDSAAIRRAFDDAMLEEIERLSECPQAAVESYRDLNVQPREGSSPPAG